MKNRLMYAPSSIFLIKGLTPRRFSGVLPAVLLSLMLCTSAGAQPVEANDVEEAAQWEELNAELPAAPSTQDLLPIPSGVRNSHSFAVDAKSIIIGKDGVIRYTLVGTSAGGARNLTYEGIRCETFERKIYAYGRPDGSWSRSKRNAWERIHRYAPNDQHVTLALDYFCQNTTIAGTERDMIERIRWSRPMTRVRE